MKALFFGTYDRRRHPRVTVLMEAFRSMGCEVEECNAPLGDSTQQRVGVMQRPWRSLGLAARIIAAWGRLIWRARRLGAPQVVVVGYLGHFDIHLARRLWPGVPVLLDHLTSLEDTARDRRSNSAWLQRVFRRIDDMAVNAAEAVIVDTGEQRAFLPANIQDRTIVVSVGAPSAWFKSPVRNATHRLRVVFFGLFTPLQGTETIGRAAARLVRAPIDFLMIGTGQDYQLARKHAGANPNVQWLDWVSADQLPATVAAHDVCLGIFGTTGKALRVVPNKVFQGAAAGCAVVTSDTHPQREALGEAGIFVAAGSDEELADTLSALQQSPERVWRARNDCYQLARERFAPDAVAPPLRDWLQGRITIRR